MRCKCKKWSVLLLILSLIFANYQAQTQVLPSDRAFDWQSAGINEAVVNNGVIINILDFEGDPDGSGTNDEAFTKALNALEGGAGTIYFPPGTYLFNSTIRLRSDVVLKGASAASTTLQFDLGGTGDLIVAQGSIETDTSYLKQSISRNSATIDISELLISANKGDYFRVALNDRHLVTSNWAYQSVGQIVRVKEVEDQLIELATPIRMNYDLSYQPFLQKINPVKNIGIECLKIERLDQTAIQTSNIAFRYSANCWIKGVEGVNSNYAHVEISYSTNIEVSESYFQDAFDHGNGGKAYGVALQYTSGECLIENNVFRHLRHAVLLQAGANANVIGYNYAVEPYWTDVSLPADAAGDIVLHGNYPYANLIEGNVIQNIVIDDSHGKNGPYNTFLRNRAKLYGIFMNNNPASDKQNFIGNVVENTGFLKGFYQIEGTDHFEYGNTHKGELKPAGSGTLPDASYYYTSKPSFLSSETWPSIGIPNIPSVGTNAAMSRYQNGSELAVCDDDSIETGLQLDVLRPGLTIYPNPFSENFTISRNNESRAEMRIYDQTGRLVLQDQTQEKKILIDLSNQPAGPYFVRLGIAGEHFTYQILKWK